MIIIIVNILLPRLR